LLKGYQLCAVTEGKSPHSVAFVTTSVRLFYQFLLAAGQPPDADKVGTQTIRAFIFSLGQKQAFSGHRLTHPQPHGLSSHTINTYMRGLRCFFSWLVREEILPESPFAKVKLPKVTRKIIPTFTDSQLKALLSVIDIKTARGYRDMAMILLMLDSGIRVSELCGLKLADVHLEEGTIKVLGKGNKERLSPIGREIQRILWRYINRFRPTPFRINEDLLFMTRDGISLNKDRLQKIMSVYGRKAGIQGVRCSAHTLRHSAAVRFLRNGGDVFSLQRMLGHSSLEMTRHYCEIADVDMKKAHVAASPVDNLKLASSNYK